MRESRPALFHGRHFRDEMIVLCVRWYLRYPLSYRNLEEMMAERGLAVGHSTIACVVPSITVLAINEGTGARFQTTADADGQYTIRAVPIGVL